MMMMMILMMRAWIFSENWMS